MHNEEVDRLRWNSFKMGDWDAYEILYEKYYRPLSNYGYKFTRDIALIEDAIHDLFVKLWNNRENLGEPVSVKNYLYKSIRGILFRKIKFQSRLSEFGEKDYRFDVSHDHSLIQKEEELHLQRVITEVMEKLPARQKEIIFLRFYEGLRYEEIAEIMLIDVKSAYKLLYKALENLHNSLPYMTLYMLLLFGYEFMDPNVMSDFNKS